MKTRTASENVYGKLTIPEKTKSTSITPGQCDFIYNFLKQKKIKKTLEVGFAYGASTASIIYATRSQHIVIDPFQSYYNRLGVKNIKKLGLKKHLRLEEDYSHNALPRLCKENVKIGFAFIDGGHKYDEVFIDFFYIDLLLQKGGFVLFDDGWMRSVELVASWIKKNKTNYKRIKTPFKEFILFQKLSKDKREWYHFKEFYNYSPRSIILHTRFKIAKRFGFLKDL